MFVGGVPVAALAGRRAQPIAPAGFIPTVLTQTKRWYWAGDTSTITQASGTVSSWADKAGSGSPMIPPSGNQPAFVASSTFGASKAALRSAPSGTGLVGHLHGSLSALAGATAFALFASMSFHSAYDSYGQFTAISTSSTGQGFIGFNSGDSKLYTSPSATEYAPTIDAPVLLALVFDGTNFTFWVNGVASGSSGYTTALAAASFMSLFYDGTDETHRTTGDARSIIFTTGALATLDRQKLEGWLSWDAVGSGSLLPSGHPYKSVSP